MFAGTTFIGWFATLSGWYVTEIGRQPFMVYGHQLTKDAVTKMVPTGNVALTLAMYVVLYAVMLTAYLAVLKYLAEHSQKDTPQQTIIDKQGV